MTRGYQVARQMMAEIWAELRAAKQARKQINQIRKNTPFVPATGRWVWARCEDHPPYNDNGDLYYRANPIYPDYNNDEDNIYKGPPTDASNWKEYPDFEDGHVKDVWISSTPCAFPAPNSLVVALWLQREIDLGGVERPVLAYFNHDSIAEFEIEDPVQGGQFGIGKLFWRFPNGASQAALDHAGQPIEVPILNICSETIEVPDDPIRVIASPNNSCVWEFVVVCC